MNNKYLVGALITGAIVFIVVWLYALSQWGFLLGIIFGWLPAIIAAVIAGLLWPLLVVLFAVLVVIWGIFAVLGAF